MQHIATGELGEKAAAEYLIAAGYSILARKYRAFTGEIDIIAKQGDTIVFVEVKARRGNGFGSPAEAVTASKQRKIINTALCFIKQHGFSDVPLRFDVVEVKIEAPGGRLKCQHIMNAFGG